MKKACEVRIRDEIYVTETQGFVVDMITTDYKNHIIEFGSKGVVFKVAANARVPVGHFPAPGTLDSLESVITDLQRIREDTA